MEVNFHLFFLNSSLMSKKMKVIIIINIIIVIDNSFTLPILNP